MREVKLADVPEGEKFYYLGHEWCRGGRDDLWISAEPDPDEPDGFYQQLWYATLVEYTEPTPPPPVRGELWSDGPPWESNILPKTVWFCQGLTMTTANGSTVPTSTFRTTHRTKSYRLYPPD